MDVIFGNRRSGKTTELIKRAAGHNGYIVCLNTKMRDEIRNMACKMDIGINKPFTYEEVFENRGQGRVMSLGLFVLHIDDVDQLLSWLLSGRIIGEYKLGTIAILAESPPLLLSGTEVRVEFEVAKSMECIRDEDIRHSQIFNMQFGEDFKGEMPDECS
jgi:hypothetical protein